MVRSAKTPGAQQPRRRTHITIDMPPELLAGLDRLARESFQGRSAYVRALVVQQLEAAAATGK